MKVWIKLSSFTVEKFATLALTGFLTTASVALAGGGSGCHFHGNEPAAESTVLTCAEQNKNRLIDKGTLDATWKTVKHNTIEQIDNKKGKKEWKLTYKDPFAKDKTKEVLYMYFSIPGNHIATNFSGN